MSELCIQVSDSVSPRYPPFAVADPRRAIRAGSVAAQGDHRIHACRTNGWQRTSQPGHSRQDQDRVVQLLDPAAPVSIRGRELLMAPKLSCFVPTVRPRGQHDRGRQAHTLTPSPAYSFRRYARSAGRSSGVGCRSKCTPSVEATGGTTTESRRHPHPLEKLDVVIDDLFQGRRRCCCGSTARCSGCLEARARRACSQSSAAGGPPTNPVNSARPGSDLRAPRSVVPSASVIGVGPRGALHDPDRATGARRRIRAGATVSTGRGHCVLIIVKPHRPAAAVVDCPRRRGNARTRARTRPCPAAPVRSMADPGRAGQSGADRVGHVAHAMVREQHPLKRRQVVEQPLRRRGLDLRVIDQRPQRLILQRCEPAVQLISTGLVGIARPGVDSSGPVSSTSLTLGTARHMSTDLSLDG